MTSRLLVHCGGEVTLKGSTATAGLLVVVLGCAGTGVHVIDALACSVAAPSTMLAVIVSAPAPLASA